MKFRILTAILAFLVVLGSSTLAQSSNAVQPGFLPDHPLVGLQDLFEQLQLFLAFSPEAKANVHFQLAEKRLAELNLSIAENKTDLIPTITQKYEREMNETEDGLNSTAATGQNFTDLAEHVAQETYKHQLALEDILGKVPDQSKDDIEHAINVSSHGHDSAVQNILEHENVTGLVNITFTIGNQTFTQTFNMTSEENNTHVEKENEHNETCHGEDCNQSQLIIKTEEDDKGHGNRGVEESELTTTTFTNTIPNTNSTGSSNATITINQTNSTSTQTTTSNPQQPTTSTHVNSGDNENQGKSDKHS